MSPPSSPPPPPIRKFPAPCWAQDETFALIQAYKGRLRDSRRGYLSAADWDTVASEVSGRYPLVSPVKTSVQCRHKMEKLRKRYRVEKQRAIGFPGGFSSSWVFFVVMNGLEIGSFSGDDSNLGPNCVHRIVGGEFSGKTDGDCHILPSGFLPKKRWNVDDKNLGSGSGVKIQFCKKFKSNHKFNGSSSQENDNGGFPVKTLGDRNLETSTFRHNIYGKFDANLNPELYSKRERDCGVDCRGGSRAKILSNGVIVPPAFRLNNRGKFDGIGDNEVDFRGMNGYLRTGGCRKKNVGVSVKRDVDPVVEMVSSIEQMGEEFMKMEMMKIDMAREMENMRMEMEMKRNKFIIESQKKIVESLVDAVLEKRNKNKKNKKVKMESPDS
ncbi:hypothetical protein UlMin_001482 [Ulmus minor]